MSQKTVKRARKNQQAQTNGAPKPAPAPEKRPPLSVPYELADNILGYLGTKPYQEVAHLIGGLMRCAPQLRKE
jgi:hypothetical protein